MSRIRERMERFVLKRGENVGTWRVSTCLGEGGRANKQRAKLQAANF